MHRAKLTHRQSREYGLVDNGRPQHNPVNTRAQHTADIGHRSDTPAKLDFDLRPSSLLQNQLEGLYIGPVSLIKSAIEIDHMKPACSGGTPTGGNGRRTAAVDCLAGRIPLGQPHHLPGSQVNGGIDYKIFVHYLPPQQCSTKFRSIINPTCWLFSG
jgi:hypothetical protein